ncbi:1677_t:CDS:2, partial [Ambispora gerdemannii]
ALSRCTITREGREVGIAMKVDGFTVTKVNGFTVTKVNGCITTKIAWIRYHEA